MSLELRKHLHTQWALMIHEWSIPGIPVVKENYRYSNLQFSMGAGNPLNLVGSQTPHGSARSHFGLQNETHSQKNPQ